MKVSIACTAVALLAGCSKDICVSAPCPLSFAVQIDVHSTSATPPLTGVFVKRAGTLVGSCVSGDEGISCAVPGGRGTYALEIGAPGFVSVQRAVDVPGTPAGCGTCGTAETQHLDVTLQPSA